MTGSARYPSTRYADPQHTPAARYADHPACADPRYLPIVDAAYETPGGPVGHWMRDNLCKRCPVADQCLHEAMISAQYGVWGGTISKQRVQHGAPSCDLRLSKPRFKQAS